MALPADFEVTPGDPNKPLVVLLHGNKGNKDHMVNPGATGFNHHFRAPMQPHRDLGWSWYPRVGPYSFVLDMHKSVRSWRQALQQQGFGTAAYSQVDPAGLLARPVQELAEVITHLRQTHPTAKLVLLAHSRGGLLARKFLKDHAANAQLVGAIAGLITLHSPHQGSTMANAALAVNSAITTVESVQPGIALALEWLRAEVNSPSYQELAIGGAFLTNLQAGERALPGVLYATFGGTSVLFSRLLTWWYTAASAVPLWNWPPYRVGIVQSEVPWASPVANGPLAAQYLGSIPELAHGKGDLLTTDAGARLPFAAHRSNPLNHAEALWDPGLQQQVLEVLSVIWPDGAVLREASSAPVYVIFGGAKFWIPSPAILENYGGWAAVQVVPNGTLAGVPSVPRDGTVLREASSAPVYVMKGGQKCWIPNPTILQNYGGWAVVRVVPDGGLATIPVGPHAA